MKKQQTQPFVVVITGPTASGKSGLSELIAEKIPSEIINADVGQFYTKLSVGTAKPDLKNYRYGHHLFDIVDSPEDISSADYRKLVINRATEIISRNKLPIIVGGSLFYIKSLFFPPHEIAISENSVLKKFSHDQTDTQENNNTLWEVLNSIDPERAKSIHHHDIYRIKRALSIWEKTGIKPSSLQPIFEPPFNVLFIFVCPLQDVLHERIKKRTELMIKDKSWIDESRQLIGTSWEEFVKTKGLIGYSDIIEWIKYGQKQESIDKLIDIIYIKTRQYAKRQITFWRGFEKLLKIESEKDSNFSSSVATLESIDTQSINKLVDDISKYMNSCSNK